MSTNLKNVDSVFLTKNIYINDFDFTCERTTSNLSNSELSELMKKLDNISDYLNTLMNEINEIKKATKKNINTNTNTNTYQMPEPNIYQSFPRYQNNNSIFYEDNNSQYSFDPDIIFK